MGTKQTYTPKIKGGFYHNAIEEPSLVLQSTFQWTVPTRSKKISYFEEHFNNLKNILSNGKIPWMLKILHGMPIKNIYF